VSSAVRGFGWAGLNTGGNTLVALIAPSARRGEASSYFTLFQSAANTVFPPLALWILAVSAMDYGIVFVLSGLLGVAGAVVAELIARPGQRPRASTPARATGGLMWLTGLYDRGVVLATVLLGCFTAAHPAVTAFVPLYALHLGIGMDGMAWYFIVAGVTALGSRVVLGKAVDRMGRGPSIVAAFLVSIVGFVFFMFAGNLAGMIVGGIFYFVGHAINSAALLALAIDLSDPHRRGAAMATFSLAYPGGVGLGSAVGGLLIELFGYEALYLGAIVAVLAGLAVTIINWDTIRQAHPAHA
jgi:predicted MFS family arabinose efflux permease